MAVEYANLLAKDRNFLYPCFCTNKSTVIINRILFEKARLMAKTAYFVELKIPKRDRDIDPPRLLPGGVPPIRIFEMDFNGLSKLVYSFEYNFLIVDKTVELCLIGLVAYFEAFCKNQFASLINICPQLLGEYKKNGGNTTIDAATLVNFDEEFQQAIGPLLAETHNFGSAKQINNEYQSLIKVTPFSKDDIWIYDQILNDRNLLVHHGGTYTSKYTEQSLVSKGKSMKEEAFHQSIEIYEDDYFEAALFILGIALKIAQSTQKALKDYIAIKGIKVNREKSTALRMLSCSSQIIVAKNVPDKKNKKA